MEEIKKQDSGYIIQLDGLRFFAIFSVMIGHWVQWQINNRPFINAFPFGNGVTLFFVLSGFLITDILLKNKAKFEQNGLAKGSLIKSFYIRRFLRIFPLYFAVIIFLYLISYKNTRELFPWLATFTSNIYQSINNAYVGDFNHFWSLAVEEQFYMFWPFLIIFVPTKHSEKAIIALIVLSIITKAYIFKTYPDKWMANSYFTLSCMHALGIGALLSYWSIYRKNLIASISKLNIIIYSIVFYFVLHYVVYYNKLDFIKEVLDNFFFAVMSGLIINYAAQNKFEGLHKSILENKFIVYSGKISYGMYIFHLFIPELFWSWICPKTGLSFDGNNPVAKYTAFACFYLVTFMLAHFSWKLFENPINNLKSRFPYFKQQ